MVSKYDLEYYEEESEKYAWTIPIACGIFTFIYWFILTPILWNAINVEEDSETFGIFMMTMAIFWCVFVGFFMCIWWFKRRTGKSFKEKTTKDRVSIVKKDSDVNVSNHSGSPPFPTKTHTVQPSDTPISYNAHCSLNGLHTGSEKDMTTISLNSYPIQPQDTPSLYNAKTGRQSLEQSYADSSNVSIPNVTKNSSDQDSSILMVKKSKPGGREMHRKISSSDSEEEKGDGLKEPDPQKSKSRHDTSITVETAIIEHNPENAHVPSSSKEALSESQVARLSSTDSFCGLPEMKSFDGYLHLTTVDTPLTPPSTGASPTSSGLTPREIFFMDLIKQAEENERAPGIRRSTGDDIKPRNRSTSDKRKSMPPYLCPMNSPESNPSTSKDVRDVLLAAGYPSDNKDPISVTDSEEYSLSFPTKIITNDELQGNLKRYENDTEPERSNPVDSPPEEDSSVTEPVDTKSSKAGSGGEYFIANVGRNKSVTSEVYLNIGDDATKVVKPGTSVQWDLVVDSCDDDDLSDDCVFEDDVALKMKKLPKNKDYPQPDI
jgi:hypothetical protein